MKQIIIGVGMVLLLGAGCQKENLVAPDISNKLLVTAVSLSELESNPAFNTLLSKAALKTGLYKVEEDANYTVLTSGISKAEFLTYEAYSFLIANPEQPAFTFDNYIIRKNHDGSVEEFILRYSYDMDAYLAQGEKRFGAISKYDTNYKLVATNAEGVEALKNGVPALKSNCEVTITVYHETPDDGNYEWEPGAVCQHTTEGDMCNVVIEYSMFCYGGGGGNDTDTEAPAPGGGSPDYGAPAEGGMLPDNGGPGNPVSVMEPPLGMEGEVISIPCPPAVNALNLALDNGLSALQLYWLTNNDDITGQLHDFIAEQSFSEDAKAFISELLPLISEDPIADSNALGFVLEAKKQDKIYHDIDESFLLSVNQFTQTDLANPENIDPIAVQFIMKCAALKELNPDWSNLKVFWEASKEVVHISLDVFGLVPVVGELADIVNGVLYVIEGDGVNATLSLASAVPFAGWVAQGTKYGLKITNAVSDINSKVKLVWKTGNNGIEFGQRSQLRKVLGLAVGNPQQAHHIIPWAKQSEDIVQQAAKDPRAFHMNEALNGIPLDNSVHLGSHNAYDNNILAKFEILEQDYPDITPEQAYDGLMDIINSVRTAIQNNPATHVNDLVF